MSKNLLFESENIKLIQCDTDGAIYFQWRNEEIKLTVCSFLALRTKLATFDLDAMLDVEHPGVELINLACIDRIWLVDIYDVIHLREAINHSLAMLEVNSFIHSSLQRTF